MAWIWWKPGDAIDAIARTPISYLGVHRVALDRVAAAHLDGLGDGFGVLARTEGAASTHSSAGPAARAGDASCYFWYVVNYTLLAPPLVQWTCGLQVIL